VIRRDYILRLIDLAAEFVLKAAGFRKDGLRVEAEQTLAEGFKSLVGMDANPAAPMALSDLVSLLGSDPGKMIAAAKLLEAEPATRGRALALFLEVHLLDGKAEYLNRTDDVHRLLQTFADAGEDVPLELEAAIARFEGKPR